MNSFGRQMRMRFPGLGRDEDDEGGGIPGWVWALIAFIVVVLIITLAVLPLGFPCKTYDIYGWCPCNPPENKKYDADKKLCSCETGYTSTDPKTKPCTQLECTGGKEVKGNACACPVGYIDNYGTCEKPAPAKTDGSGTPGSSTPGGTSSAPLSSPISFMGKTCSPEDRTQVQVGLLTSRAQRATRFTKGADYGYGWDWTHPQLCEYSNLDDVTADVYGFCKTGTGYDEKMGHLFKGDIYGNGGSQPWGDAWWWTHPYSCNVKDNKKTACGVARTTCPIGYNDKGAAGFIVSKGQSYGAEGAAWSDWHTWAHPRLCCPW